MIKWFKKTLIKILNFKKTKHYPLESNQDIARFLTSKNHFNSTMIKPAAFFPHKNETSVFQHGSVPIDALWKIGKDNILEKGRSLHGAAICKVKDIKDISLEVISAVPPELHAIIVGWPECDDSDRESAEHLRIAMLIAQKASLFKYKSQ